MRQKLEQPRLLRTVAHMWRTLFFIVLSSQAAVASETMRIAVGAEGNSVTVEAKGLAWSHDDDTASFTDVGVDSLRVDSVGQSLSVAGEALPVPAIRLRGDGVLKVNGVRLRGEVAVVRGRRGLAAINILPLEDYLTGVLGSEMPRSFPPEALKAQAVAARTYALSKKLEQYGQPSYLGSSVISQVYKGLDAEASSTRAAIEATRGLVLTYQLQPIEAYFHASCGGHTESGQDALGRPLPYLKSVSCPCGQLPTSHWRLKLASADLTRALGGAGGPLAVVSRTPTGRARRVQIGTRGWDAVSFRERLGYMTLKSLNFKVEQAKGGVELVGDGFGHGAGLCQWGARVLAERGLRYSEILAHYYPGTELQTLY